MRKKGDDTEMALSCHSDRSAQTRVCALVLHEMERSSSTTLSDGNYATARSDKEGAGILTFVAEHVLYVCFGVAIRVPDDRSSEDGTSVEAVGKFDPRGLEIRRA